MTPLKSFWSRSQPRPTICRKHLANNIPMKRLTQEQCREYNNATNYLICAKPFKSKDKKVHDHEHLVSEYRDPAHNTWNLNHHTHVFFFNIRNFSHKVRNIQRREALLNINLVRVSCNLHLSKCFFNTSSLVQSCKQY